MKYIVEHLHSKFIFWSNIRFTLYYGRKSGFQSRLYSTIPELHIRKYPKGEQRAL